mgnify:CR=1 FL=1
MSTETPREQKNDIDIAILKRDMSEIKTTVNKIDARFDLMDKEYVKRAEFENQKSNSETTHTQLHQAITDLRNSQQTELIINSVFRSQVKTWGIVISGELAFLQFVIQIGFSIYFK